MARSMFNPWKIPLQLALIGAESQAVIAMRIWGKAGLWSVTGYEDTRMIAEKTQAATKSVQDASRAVLAGKRPDQVLAAAIKPVRQKTRANARRLAKRGPKLR